MVTANVAIRTARPDVVHPSKATFVTLEEICITLLAGCILGWSAPGMDQWYLAWVGLAPLFWTCFRAPSAARSALHGTTFGLGYNLVFLHWYLQIRPATWSAIFSINPAFSCVFAWLTMSLWQGLFIGAFCYVLRRLPFCDGFLPTKNFLGQWRLPLFTVAPLLYVLLVEKLANHPALLGVPWSMLEYSQYKQPLVLQVASLIGGSGIAFAIVMCNLLVARGGAGKRNTIIGSVLLCAMLLFGLYRLDQAQPAATVPSIKVCALQANATTDTTGTSPVEIFRTYFRMALSTKADLCVWPEWSMPLDWTKQQNVVSFLAQEAKTNKQSWLIGAFDTANGGTASRYNCVGLVRSDGTAERVPYHKQYLVPFGEYTPDWVYYNPVVQLFDPQHTVSHGMIAGNRTSIFNGPKGAKIGPMICFENCLPQIAAASVRHGANVLVDCSNTSWFYHSGLLGKQLTAFSVMRAVETHRSFVFCTVLGPSVIIDPNGRILSKAWINQSVGVEASVPLYNDLTPFARLCMF